MGVGISPPRSLNVSPAEKREIAQKRVEETSEELGMDLYGELEGVDVGDLGPHTVAATVPTPTGARVIFDQSNFFRKSEEGQKRTTGHELGHVKQFNRSLDDWAKDEFNVSDEFADELGDNYGSVADMEGEIEAILEPLFPGQNSSYPYFQAAKKQEWESKGIDINSELSREIEQMEKEVLSEYRDVYDSFSSENIYMEAGSIDGTEYLVAVYGEGAEMIGEEIAENYIEELAGDDEPEGLAGEISEYISDIQEELLNSGTSSGYEVEYGEGENGFDSPVEDDIGTPKAEDPGYAGKGRAT